jgi:hypothetical protein
MRGKRQELNAYRVLVEKPEGEKPLRRPGKVKVKIALLQAVKAHRVARGQGSDLDVVAVVRKRIIPTERPPLVGEVSANFCG